MAVDIYNAMQSSNVNMASTEPGSSKHTIPGPSSNEIPETMRYYTPAALPIWLPIIYVGSNVVLTSLNWYWFGKMITTIKARFDPNAQRIATQKQVKNHEAGQATSVQAKEAVRKRRA